MEATDGQEVHQARPGKVVLQFTVHSASRPKDQRIHQRRALAIELQAARHSGIPELLCEAWRGITHFGPGYQQRTSTPSERPRSG